jgi:hypothetical protein
MFLGAYLFIFDFIYLCSAHRALVLNRFKPSDMTVRLRSLFVLVFTVLFSSASYAQNEPMDYLRHMKYFNLCSMKKECSNCYSCSAQKVRLKIKNMSDKEVTHITYTYYSDVYKHLMVKEALLEGYQIDGNQTGFVYVCVPDSKHWAISELVYADGSNVRFEVKDDIRYFLQEADECDCNPQTHIKPPLNQ